MRRDLVYTSFVRTNHTAAHVMQEDVNHFRNVRYGDREQIIGGHCAQVPLLPSFPPPSLPLLTTA